MFNLLRYFSLTSAVVIVVIALAMQAVYRQNAVDDLVTMAESHNVSLSQSFANTLWPRFASHVTAISGADGDALRTHLETGNIHEAVKTLTLGLPVLKVKIYNLDGLTVYSSDPSQMGEDKSKNPGFLKAAREGTPASKLSYRDTFSAFSGVVEDRDLVESYIPVRGPDGRIEGVFELYTDVTPFVMQIGTNSSLVIYGLLLSFGLLYAILFLIVRHADRVIKKQYRALRGNEENIKAKNAALEHEVAERLRAEKALQESHDSLERRVQDRTAELRKNEKHLILARDQAESANRAKSEFLAAMGHELRTPLNAVIGFSEIIKNELLGPVGEGKYTEYANHINGSGQHLLKLINDILDLSKVEHGEAALDQETLDVPELIQSVVESAQSSADTAGIDLTLDSSGELPALRADERKLKQILGNLLSNAIKFTETGGKVTLKVRCGTTSGHVFQIIDTGIGIAPDDIPKAMSHFGQVDGDLNRRYEGTGLGLPLTSALVELHGGSLDIHSEIGVGTTVTVRFPAERIVRLQKDAQSPNMANKRVG
jgi:signal transduction histidine kinase